MKKTRVKLTGAFGATEVRFDPRTRRALTIDVKNCPHCGVHHASLMAVMEDDRITVCCPALGGRPIYIKFFIKVFVS